MSHGFQTKQMLEMHRLWLRSDPVVEDNINTVHTGVKRKLGTGKQLKRDLKRRCKDLTRAKTKRDIIFNEDVDFEGLDLVWL